MGSNKKMLLTLTFMGGLVSWAWFPNTRLNLIEETPKVVVQEQISTTLDMYFPMIRDTVWVYNGTTYLDTLTVSVDFIRGNAIQLRYQAPDSTFLKIYVEEDDGIYEVATIEDVYAKKDYTDIRQYKYALIPMPIELCDWQISNSAHRILFNMDIDINTEFGNLNGIEIVTLEPDVFYKHYYADKIGLAKIQIYRDDRLVMTYSLDEYSQDSPLREKVRVYWADVENNRLVYEDVEVFSRTNEEPRHFLSDLLSMTHEKYVPALTNHAFIQSIYKDEHSGIIYVDMSDEYLLMNYDKNTEYLVVQSLLNTVATYYQGVEIILSVDRKPYRSSQLHFDDNELIPINLVSIEPLS
ncbi:MAG: hypothetical protein ATN36_04015 [Epulopiscium sp. Nele67-Bin005]|nr:MAG: hypothetical protein ATN36_04015 [Epulopiscium sp. Nele67-Bin005]